ncbi:MAG: hypothetical protein ACE148_11785 [Vicinamibacterales bacterium]
MARVPLIALVGGVGIIAAWLAGSAGARSGLPRHVPPARDQPSQFDPLIEEVRSHASRLERYRSEVPPPRRGGRDPFRFASRPQRQSRAVPEPAGPTLVDSRPAAAYVELDLIGIAEDRQPDGKVRRIAVISGLGQLFLVEEGREFGGRFEVVGVGADAAAVLDRTTGEMKHLALR